MKLIDFLRPLLRAFPRQSIRFLDVLGAGWGHDPDWQNVEPRFRAYIDPVLQSLVTVDMSEWGGRACYYWGRFYDVSHQLLLKRILKPGDTYLDAGANLGFQSLLASRLVGRSGQVHSIEPNPPTFRILSGHMAINRIQNCQLHNLALGEAEGEAILNQTEAHSGTATLRQLDAAATQSVAVRVTRGDDIFRNVQFTGRTVLKVDVEGFELLALRGMSETLKRVSIAVVEVTPEWLVQQGGSARELITYMEGHGFKALIPNVQWTFGLFSPSLHFSEPGPVDIQTDICFVREPQAFLAMFR